MHENLVIHISQLATFIKIGKEIYELIETVYNTTVHIIFLRLVFILVLGTAFSITCFIGAVIYFPLKPPKPPSKSQLEKRKDFWQGLKLLVL